MPTKIKFSHQRELVSFALHDSREHLSAYEIYEAVKKIKPDISLATVYRNLHKLEDMREISKVEIPDMQPRYEIAREPHHHFICTNCGKIEHLESPGIIKCNRCLTEKNDFTIDRFISTIFGTCCNCKKNNAGRVISHYK